MGGLWVEDLSTYLFHFHFRFSDFLFGTEVSTSPILIHRSSNNLYTYTAHCPVKLAILIVIK